MAVALEQFVKQLADSGVIAPGKLESFVPPQAQPKDAQELARLLVQSKCLTKFQAQEIYSGRAKSLILGNYTLVDKIGAGGMGQVFKAEHRRMHRTVAIKMLPAAMMKDEAAAARFQREVEAASKLLHPNIVSAFDADEANGVHFLVMEYVEGSDLSALVKKNGPLPLDKAVNYVLQAAKGLEFAHSEGVVHRDIKPANLLLDKKGVVKILDMGLARINSGDDAATQAELTGTGAVLGTVDYMAPEQALSTKHADARADIYSLGCSLHYLATGNAAYDGDTLMAKLLAHRESPIPTLGVEAPEQVQAVFEKMVAKKVADRYQTMSAVVADLQECAAAISTIESPLTAPESSLGNSNLSFLAEATAHTHHHTATKHAKQNAEAAKPIKKSTGGNRRKRLLVGGLLGGLILLAGVIFKMRTKDGTLVVEINQPDAVVQVSDDAGKVEITQPGEKGTISISVEPGKHRLKVVKDGFKFYTQDFVIESGGQTSLKATLQPVGEAPLAANGSAAETGKPIDLLKLINLQRDVAKGTWSLIDGALVSRVPNGGNWGVVNIRYDPPADYQITITATRTGYSECLLLGLPIGAQRATAEVDGSMGQYSGFALRDGRFLDRQNIERQDQPYFKDGLPATVICTVHDGVAELRVAGQKIASASADAKLALGPDYVPLHPAPLFIAAWSDFKITKLELLPLDSARPGRPLQSVVNWDTPAFQLWMKEVANLSAEKQVEAVAKQLVELNPSFDGKLMDFRGDGRPKIENGMVTDLWFVTDNVTDISPVRALKDLQRLRCPGSAEGKGKLSDLSPLKGMKLTELDCGWSQVADLSPLKEMKLTKLSCGCTHVADLTPLKGMPLKGSPLRELHVYNTLATDLSPLAGMNLKILCFSPQNIRAGLEVVRGMASLEQMGTNYDTRFAPSEFWKKYDAGEFGKPAAAGAKSTLDDPAFQKWMKGVAALTAEEQVTAVAKELVKLNPRFDGQITRTIDNGAVTELIFSPDDVMDIAPLSSLSRLKALRCNSSGRGSGLCDLSPLRGMPLKILRITGTQISDLSPLAGMSLTELDCQASKVADLSPLRGMPLTYLDVNRTAVSELAPLKGMPLTDLKCFQTATSDLSPLAGMPLRFLDCGGTTISDLSPLKGMKLTKLLLSFTEVADLSPLQGMPLTECQISGTRVSDLSPLKGMGLETLFCTDTQVFDLSPLTEMSLRRISFSPRNIRQGLVALRTMKSLGHIAVKWQGEWFTPAEFWKKYDAGEFGRPAAAAKSTLDDPAFQKWMKEVAALPAAQLVKAVVKKLQELNPEFNGHETHRIDGSAVTELDLWSDGSNAAPLRALRGLRRLTWNASSLADLTPLAGMQLSHLSIGNSKVANLKPLSGMPLENLWCGNTPVADLSPLEGMKLKSLICDSTNVADLSPLTGMPLETLYVEHNRVTDLSPLAGMKLTELCFDPDNIRNGLDIVRRMESLIRIGKSYKAMMPAAEFWKKYDAGEFGTPAVK